MQDILKLVDQGTQLLFAVTSSRRTCALRQGEPWFLKNLVTPQYGFRWLHQKAGLSRFGSADCLTELGIVHQGVARQKIARSCLCCATPWWYEAREGVPAGPKRDNLAVHW